MNELDEPRKGLAGVFALCVLCTLLVGVTRAEARPMAYDGQLVAFES